MTTPSCFFDDSPDKGAASITDAAQTGLDITGDFTCEFWIRARAAGGGDQGDIITKLRGASGDEPYAIFKNGDDLHARIYSGSSVVSVAWTDILTNDGSTWEHIAIVCTIANANATKFELFKNGTSQGNGTVIDNGTVVSMPNTTGDFVLGNANVRPDGINADLFDVRIWAAVRSGANILANYNKVFLDPDLETNLVGDWFVGGAHMQDRAQLTTGRNDLTAGLGVSFVLSAPDVTGPQTSAGASVFNDGAINPDEIWPVDDATYPSGDANLISGGGDPVAPILTNLTPAEGTTLQPLTVISFDLTSPTGVQYVNISAQLEGDAEPRVAYNGQEFLGHFVESTITPISGGFHLDIRFQGGWPREDLALTIQAVSGAPLF